MQANEVPGRYFLNVIDNLLSPDECHELIKHAHGIQNDDAGNRSWHEPGTAGKYKRSIMIDSAYADNLWERIQGLKILPETFTGENGTRYKVLYLNSHFRFSRYTKGGLFSLHCDGKNYDNSRPELTDGYATESLLTLNIFLNDKNSIPEPLLEGGHTDFFETDAGGFNFHERQGGSVAPRAGRAALFWADQYHRGNKVTQGHKYLLRTDVMGVQI